MTNSDKLYTTIVLMNADLARQEFVFALSDLWVCLKGGGFVPRDEHGRVVPRIDYPRWADSDVRQLIREINGWIMQERVAA